MKWILDILLACIVAGILILAAKCFGAVPDLPQPVIQVTIIKSVNAPVLIQTNTAMASSWNDFVAPAGISNAAAGLSLLGAIYTNAMWPLNWFNFVTTTNQFLNLTNPNLASLLIRGVLLVTNLASGTLALDVAHADPRAVGFNVYCNGVATQTGLVPTLVLFGLVPGQPYTFTAAYRDAQGGESPPSQPVIYWPLPVPQTNTLNLKIIRIS